MSPIPTNIASRFLSHINKGEHTQAGYLLANDAICFVPESIPGGGPKTKAEYLELLGQVVSLFHAQPQYEILTTTADSERVCLQVRGRGELKNGKAYDNKYCFVFELSKGKISAIHEYLDTQYASGVVFS